MSFKVLVIPEDFTKDEHILKPVVERVLADAGRPNAVVQVCRNPNFQGISECLRVDRLRDEVVLRYPMVNLFLLLVDRDGQEGRQMALNRVQQQLAPHLDGRHFLVEMARQEVEILPIAGHQLSIGWNWRDIRDDADVKNTYFVELAKREKVAHLPHQGRARLIRTAVRQWSRICRRCPEETTQLSQRIRNLF